MRIHSRLAEGQQQDEMRNVVLAQNGGTGTVFRYLNFRGTKKNILPKLTRVGYRTLSGQH